MKVSKTNASCIDDFGLEKVGLDFITNQITPGDFFGQSYLYMDAALHVGNRSATRAVEDFGSVPKGTTLFCLPVSGNELVVRGERIGPAQAAIIPEGEELHRLLPAGSSYIPIAVKSALWQRLKTTDQSRYLDKLQFRGFKKIGFQNSIFMCQAETMSFLRAMTDEEGPRKSKRYIERYKDNIQLLLMSLLVSEKQALRCNGFEKIVKRAVACAHSDELKRYTVLELSIKSNTSVRNLELAFYKAMGISPKAYINAVLLGRVRRGLKQGRYESIRQACESHGIRHMGNFSKNYRRMFGEVPSSTAKLVWL
ncbi:helix-turn-helix domain-containing protein [Agaribacterium haliotis]|uniref:helix-turn-helix domain-containing protein n=1 Tax=Agaribacterium haliotis TaxID=2013869 RepID=UPI000BB54A9E|nr:helix-turn-helix domain-containing protein [Agaribacterium haliotis]